MGRQSLPCPASETLIGWHWEVNDWRARPRRSGAERNGSCADWFAFASAAAPPRQQHSSSDRHSSCAATEKHVGGCASAAAHSPPLPVCASASSSTSNQLRFSFSALSAEVEAELRLHSCLRDFGFEFKLLFVRSGSGESSGTPSTPSQTSLTRAQNWQHLSQLEPPEGARKTMQCAASRGATWEVHSLERKVD